MMASDSPRSKSQYATWDQLLTKLFSEKDPEFCDLILLTYRNFGQSPHQLLGTLFQEFDKSVRVTDFTPLPSSLNDNGSSGAGAGGDDKSSKSGRRPSTSKKQHKANRERQKCVEYILKRWLKLGTDFLVDPTLLQSLVDWTSETIVNISLASGVRDAIKDTRKRIIENAARTTVTRWKPSSLDGDIPRSGSSEPELPHVYEGDRSPRGGSNENSDREEAGEGEVNTGTSPPIQNNTGKGMLSPNRRRNGRASKHRGSQMLFALPAMKSDLLAELIAIQGSRMFCSIPCPEVMLWSKQQHPEDAPRLFNFIEWSRMVTRWFIYEILTRGGDPHERASLITRTISVAAKSRSLQDFNGVMIVLCALHNPAISRLDKSWTLVTAKTLKLFGELCALMSANRNFQMYRTMLEDSHGAVVPHIGVSLMDLVYLDESRSSYGVGSKGSMVDFTKMVDTATLLKRFMELQEKEIDSSSRHRGLSELQRIVAPPDTELLALSYRIESEDANYVRLTFQHNYTYVHPIYSALEPVPTGQANLTHRDFKLFLTGARTVTKAHNEVISEQGVLIQRLFRIKRGQVRMERRGDDKKHILGENEMFGELSLLDKYAHTTSTAIAHSPEGTELYSIEATFLYQLFESEPELGRRFFEMLARKLCMRLRRVNKATSRRTQSARKDSMAELFKLNVRNHSSSTIMGKGNHPHSSSLSKVNSDPELANHVNRKEEKSTKSGNKSTPTDNDNDDDNNNDGDHVSSASPDSSHSVEDAKNDGNSWTKAEPPAAAAGAVTGKSGAGKSGHHNADLSSSNSVPLLYSQLSSGELLMDEDEVFSTIDGKLGLKATKDQSADASSDEAYCRKFNLPPGEALLKTYPCSRTQRTLRQMGQLYISQNYVCFAAKVFHYEVREVLRFVDVRSLKSLSNLRISINTRRKNLVIKMKNADAHVQAYDLIASVIAKPTEAAAAVTTESTDSRKVATIKLEDQELPDSEANAVGVELGTSPSGTDSKLAKSNGGSSGSSQSTGDRARGNSGSGEGGEGKSKRRLGRKKNKDNDKSVRTQMAEQELSRRDTDGAVNPEDVASKGKRAIIAGVTSARFQIVDQGENLNLQSSDWDLILSGAKQVRYKLGDVIVEEGSRKQRLFHISSGSCRILKKPTVSSGGNASAGGARAAPVLLATLRENETFGELSFLDERGASASVVAHSPHVDVYVVEGYFLNILFTKGPGLGARFFRYLCCILAQRLQRIQRREDAQERVVPDIIDEPLHLDIPPLSVQDLREGSGSSSATVRVFVGPLEEEEELRRGTNTTDYCCCKTISTYPYDPERPMVDGKPQRIGDPICDQYYLRFYQNRALVAVADGCSWGEAPRNAAVAANRAFIEFMSKYQRGIDDIQQAGRLVTRAFSIAHDRILTGQAGKQSWEIGTTTLFGGIMLQLATPQVMAGHDTPAEWVFVYGNLGDCKAFHYNPRNGHISDITPEARVNNDASDCGGRLGPFVNGQHPDLRNFRLRFMPCWTGDLIFVLSDGVYDNLDPEHLGKEPEEMGLEAESWDEAPFIEAEKLRLKFRLELLRRIILPEYRDNSDEDSATASTGSPGNSSSTGSAGTSGVLKRTAASGELKSRATAKIVTAEDQKYAASLPSHYRAMKPHHITWSLLEQTLETNTAAIKWMEANPKKPLKPDYKKYPGKMDHTTCASFRVGYLDDQGNVEKVNRKLSVPSAASGKSLSPKRRSSSRSGESRRSPRTSSSDDRHKSRKSSSHRHKEKRKSRSRSADASSEKSISKDVIDLKVTAEKQK